jgi:MFS family permease
MNTPKPAPVDTAALARRIDTRSGPLSTGQIDDEPQALVDEAAGFKSVLRNHAFLRLWIAQASSQTAQNVIWWALFIQIASLTGGAPASIGVIILMVQLPTILFAGLSGVLVDRFSKHAILVTSNAVRAFGCLGYLTFLNQTSALYVITFFVAVVNQPFQPAESATIPLLVGEKQLLPANALFQITFMCSQVIGYTLAPLLVGLPFIGVSKTLIVGALFLAFAAIVLLPLPQITRERRQVASKSARHAAMQMLVELVEVAKVVARDTPLAVALIQLSLAPAVLLVLSELGPHYVQELLGTGQANAMILLVAPAGAGLGLGLFLIDRVGQKMAKGRVASQAMLAMGLAIGALAVVPNVTGVLLSGLHISRTVGASIMTVPISFVLGIATALLNAPAQTIVQERASSNLRGRVLAVQQALAAAVTIPPLLAVAVVGQLLTVPQTLGILAAVIFVAGLLSRRLAL